MEHAVRRGIAGALLGLSLAALLPLAAAPPLFADEGASDPYFLLLDKALKVRLVAKVIGSGEEMVWNMETTYITISGRTVTVPLKGSNLFVLINITPYKEDDGNILLVAQGHVWLTNEKNEKVQYLTARQSMPVSFGEKILFYPLGVDIKRADTESDTIQLQVEVLPYQEG